jgi:hypothetical protein
LSVNGIRPPSVSPPPHGSRWRRTLARLTAAVLLSAGAVVLPIPVAQAATVDPTAWYVLINRNSGKALDVCANSTADGACVQQWTRHNGTNQQFQFIDSGGGFYRLRARHSGKVLDVFNASTADNTAIVQWPDNGGTNQQFRLADSPDGYVRLINRNSGKTAEIAGSATTDGARLVQNPDTGATNQQWQLANVGSDPNPWPPSPTFGNPVVWQDFADDEVIRVGNVYYYTASTMHYSPGAPILRSYDLVNWEYAGNSVPSLDFDSTN